jgi:hypothetical protein
MEFDAPDGDERRAGHSPPCGRAQACQSAEWFTRASRPSSPFRPQDASTHRRQGNEKRPRPFPFSGSWLSSALVLNVSLIVFSALSFLGYGVSCVFSTHMKREFERYRLGPQRVLIGSLQLLASISLLAGLSRPWIGRSAATGLALMMLTGVIVRFKIKHSLVQMTPALFYMLLNAYLSVAAF